MFWWLRRLMARVRGDLEGGLGGGYRSYIGTLF